MERLTKLRDGLKPQTGVIHLPTAKASLNLGKGYYFLSAEDAKKVLVEGWGNPPGSVDGVLGMIFPTGKSFLDDSWGAVVQYHNTFYVSDDDAKTADYDKMMGEMRSGVEEENAQREKDGYEKLNLVGWAQPPTYDAGRHDLIWARDIQFGDQTDHTLNYDVRHLGREGVLSMNMVSQMSRLPDVRQAAVDLARTAEFDKGSRYADYRKGDKVAGYGLAGLVAAGVGLGVAKKAGALAIALVFLKKAGVFIVAGLAAAANWLRGLFRKKDV